MLTPQQHIVCLGQDQMLLSTRRELLHHVGFEAIVTSEIIVVAELLLKGEISILILCHTLLTEEVEAILKFHQEIESTALILSLAADWWKPEMEGYGEVCDARKGPAAFLAAIMRMCKRQTCLCQNFRQQPHVHSV